MIIGVGFHARRIYIPTLVAFSRRMPMRLMGGIDLEGQRESIERYLRDKGFQLKMQYLKPSEPVDHLSGDCTKILDAFVKEFNIQGVVISTEPLAHKAYAKWALERNLHILMDKPVSVRKSLTTDFSQASGLIRDYQDLLDLYKRQQHGKSTVFSVNVQRRYEYGFEKVKSLITETRERFNVPVTSIQSMHADGTWIFPKEVLYQQSHPYFHGYGKSSHSGYHIFDMVWQLYEAGQVRGKEPESMEVFSSFLSPSGFSIDISEADYRQYFNDAYEPTNLSEAQYQKKVQAHGEIDSFSVVRLLKNRENICNISINLLHNSFSRRAWAAPNSDLYKGNGRVRHQQFIIQQGPFQCIQIHSYQSKDQHDVDNSNEFDVGGNNHFDIYVFRNSQMFGSGSSFSKISSKDLESEQTDKLILEKAKDRVILEFVEFMLGKIDKKSLKSNIDSQTMPVKIMSGIYQSHVRMSHNQNPLITIRL